MLEMPEQQSGDNRDTVEPAPPPSSPSTSPPPNTLHPPSIPFPQVVAYFQSLLSPTSPLPLLYPPQVHEWSATSILNGLNLAYQGCISTLRTPRTRKTLYKAFGYLILVTGVLFATTHIVFFPFRLLHIFSETFVKPVFGPTVTGILDWMMDNVDAVVKWFLFVTPDAGLYLLRYAWPEPLDRLFFEALRGLTLQLALPSAKARFVMRFARVLDEPMPVERSAFSALTGSVSTQQGRRSWTLRILSYLKRYAKRIIILAVIYIASLVPVLGLLAWPAATFTYLGFAVGFYRAAWMCAAGLISPPWWKFVTGPMLRGIWGFRALERELVEPYLCRSQLNSSQRRAWLARNEPIIAGFTLPFWFCLSIPWVGPLMFGLAQAAAARLCVEIFDEVDIRMGREAHLRKVTGGSSDTSSASSVEEVGR
ncbi:uncharacterized protein SPPG_03634 [Spizellomyces punctatus DAOM BR117]|uniref:Uncharacterized protein n=1 Tax=Spizellomyces punctatus (strain DAOM BR117) TaxID=645134 RepID=A0A0L0HLZ5_SPIPD|nr:uncharacterized protein SPPG_03634 [Spizellomyces punctatus DAOM BR117]KND01844.1 hypothetical protein SPPG_03634 [Spizellomyces punctatus DAOM BR117]|eukprot:XP_016609883.1 hypothetical protein SPPG_03634 [Spizellomyces punctatus DAOM BR117]